MIVPSAALTQDDRLKLGMGRGRSGLPAQEQVRAVSYSGHELEFPPPLQEMPRYHELPTLEERPGPLLLGATSLGSPIGMPLEPSGMEGVSLDLEDEEEGETEENYLDKINPIYDTLSYDSPSDSYQGKGFIVSRAMYV